MINEALIKELANEAGYDNQIFEISKEGLTKLVMLTVQECWSIAYQESCYSDPENTMGFDIAKKIDAHFGVEE